jgi:hypothetical protein
MKQVGPQLQINRFGTVVRHIELVGPQAPSPARGAQIVRRLPDSTALTRLVQAVPRPIR